jgi:hypothetical protein
MMLGEEDSPRRMERKKKNVKRKKKEPHHNPARKSSAGQADTKKHEGREKQKTRNKNVKRIPKERVQATKETDLGGLVDVSG